MDLTQKEGAVTQFLVNFGFTPVTMLNEKKYFLPLYIISNIILMYNPLTYEVADVISTYVYRQGLLEMNYSYAAAVGMFNSVVSFTLVWITNKISDKLTGSSLW